VLAELHKFRRLARVRAESADRWRALAEELGKALQRVQPQVTGVLCVQDVEAALRKLDEALKEQAGEY